MKMKERWFITGGAGFIGSNLAQALVAKEYSVTVFDDLSLGKLSNLEGAGEFCGAPSSTSICLKKV